MVLKTKSNRLVWPVESRATKNPKIGQNWLKPVKNHVEPGIRGKSNFAPSIVFKSMVLAIENKNLR